MELNFIQILSGFWTDFVKSELVYYLKIIGGAATVVLLVADFLLLRKRIMTDVKIALYGAPIPSFKKGRIKEGWARIESYVAEGSLASMKVGVIEADKLLDEILDQIGYLGDDVGARLEKIGPGQLLGIDEARVAHEMAKKIAEDPVATFDFSELKNALSSYENFFRGIRALD